MAFPTATFMKLALQYFLNHFCAEFNPKNTILEKSGKKI